MTELVDALIRLWSDPLPADDKAARASFRALYTDPVTVNGAPVSAAKLLASARALQAAYADVRREVLEVVESGDRLAVAFRLTGRHTGRLVTPLGTVAPTGLTIGMRVIDILTVTGGRISAVWAVADELGQLTQLDAVRLV